MRILRLAAAIALLGLALTPLKAQAKWQRRYRCAMCTKVVQLSTAHRIHMKNGKVYYGCCSHCGAMLCLKLGDKVERSGATDFAQACPAALWDKTPEEIREFCKKAKPPEEALVPADKAFYIMACPKTGKGLVVCCAQSIMAFKEKEAAQAFQEKWGGMLFTWEELLSHLKAMNENPKACQVKEEGTPCPSAR